MKTRKEELGQKKKLTQKKETQGKANILEEHQGREDATV